jgi:ribosomal protein S18 acetylase RimI-like enzyme
MLIGGTYFKRYRMERLLADLPDPSAVPAGYELVPWRRDLPEAHAAAMFGSFRDEIDSAVFPSFGYRAGCTDLMEAIYTKSNFVPEATWLLVSADGPCATIQGLRDKCLGAVQNLGVCTQHRGRGLGKLLLLKALHGFRQAGLKLAYLEVTVRNEVAMRLYRQLGFRCTRTIYKPVVTIDAATEVTI